MTATTTKQNFATELDQELQALCDRYGIGAVGNALARKYGRTQAIAAYLGQLPDSTTSVIPTNPH
ncbi:hypothetical protein PN498_17855 [Oscillatoria sp. CS-180]|uniref:hypothetical protein n=1 Tax=Oscillatoria sp. CS-180 TaxID=3021720 RepID=UPI00232C9BEA|nr:hypothetical protein [Oscillatoria sp. CS-180]MDB9527865.1 hypothetical protein [Oscillatoria sp. CS-180]